MLSATTPRTLPWTESSLPIEPRSVSARRSPSEMRLSLTPSARPSASARAAPMVRLAASVARPLTSAKVSLAAPLAVSASEAAAWRAVSVMLVIAVSLNFRNSSGRTGKIRSTVGRQSCGGVPDRPCNLGSPSASALRRGAARAPWPVAPALAPIRVSAGRDRDPSGCWNAKATPRPTCRFHLAATGAIGRALAWFERPSLPGISRWVWVDASCGTWRAPAFPLLPSD